MELSIIFFILAGILITLLIGYSILSSRREKSHIFENDFASRPQQPITPLNELSFSHLSQNEKYDNVQDDTSTEQLPENNEDSAVEKSINKIKIRLNNKKNAKEKQKSEERQLSLFNTQDTIKNEEEEIEVEKQAPEVTQTQENTTEEKIITLYLVAPENKEFSGEEIVQKLEEMGFQYGEHKIFHRHIDNSASPIIFSVANMMQPGVFDLDKIHSFSTIGLLFFMYIPSAGNDVTNLRLMISTVESLSKSLGGFVLNDQQALFDKQSHSEYIRRVQ
ncbi:MULTISPECIES: cell division protein ZipA [Pasteurellaceae]|uniref:Cell division protein ZipA n=1 Tax=Pasteurella atlantica TaxID=2827233 RepID=A0AAW8CNC4_9PAST|nr:cell division protein ZipA [Pasteurella atlantica]MBR0573156.1 cell division protein ZipA [Pasteurella atlantica]MDP8038987.1 cell division protein ZipA [Pasteurella atlantica]MDP8041077.1 cell division protein ZipA [Pasteurella atlantica]MDP8043310.1 cell division protein ZipA [Pasteurella atlantica]MDP8045396.1 cell division protein ZipA [Pasteurella atlantica]